MMTRIMLRWRQFSALLLLGAGFLFGAGNAYANNCVSIAAGGNWGTAGTWTGCGGLVPQNADNVTITAGGTVTLNANTNSIAALTVAGTLALGNSTTARTLRVANITVNPGGVVRVANFTVTHALIVSGNIVNNGTFDLRLDANSLCNATFNGAGTQTVSGGGATTEFNNVTVNNNLAINMSGAATVTQTGTLGVTGNLAVQAGTLRVSNTTSVSGTTDISGTLTIASTTGTKTFIGAVTINNGGTWSNTANEPVTMRNNLTNNGTFGSGTGTYTFATNSAQWAGSSGLTFAGAVTVSANRVVNTPTNVTGTLAIASGITVTNNSTVTASGAITGGAASATWTNAANSTLNVSGALLATGTLNASANPNTVNYAGAAQTVKRPSGAPATYYNLSLGGTGTKTMPAFVMTISNNFALSSTGALAATAAQALTIGGDMSIGSGATFNASTRTHNLAGNFSNSGTFTASTSTMNLNGTAGRTIGGTVSTTFYRLTIANAAGVALSSVDATVGNLLTFTSGTLSSGSGNTVIIPATGTVTRTSGHVIGNLQKNVATGATSRTFEIGDANAYAPVTIAFGSVATAGNLIATTASGEHPDIANSAIDSTQDVNRYWTVTNSGVIFDSYSATFTYASGSPVDLDSGVTPSIFSIGQADGCDGSVQNCTWTYPTVVGTPTSTGAQASGMTGFSHFVVGRKIANFLVEGAGGGSIGTQVQNVAFNIRVTARDAANNTVTGFTGTVQISSGCTLSAGSGTSANFVNGVLASWSVTVSNTGTCTITATRTGGAENGTSNSFTVGSAVSQFDGCEYTTPRCTPGAANFNRLFTKLANNAFTLDLVALQSGGSLAAGFSGTVAVDLLANSAPQAVGADNCPASQTAVIPLGNSTFSSGRPAAPISVAANAFSSVTPNYSAYRDIRVRVTCNSANCPPGGITYCSADNFSVRPQDLAISSNMTNSAQTGSPSLAAGADFTLAATAVAGYAGSPQLDRTANKLATHVGLTDYTTRLRDSTGANAISFPAATIGTGASSATVQYHDAGNFRVLAGGIVDNGFTVDDPSKGDCVSGSSSNADNDGNANNGLVYGCNIANQTDSSLFGRFFPGYYVVSGSPSVSAACTAGGYSYMGDANIGLGFTISAMSQDNPGGATLKLSHYTSGYGTLASVNVAAENGSTATDLSGNFTPSLAYSASNWSSGDYPVSGSTYAFTRPAGAPSGPYDSLYVAAGVTDADGAALGGLDFKLGDPTCTVSCTHKKLSASPTRIRFGRLYVPNTYGTEKLDLTIPLEAQYWTGSIWARNSLDSCTSITTPYIVLGNHTGGLNSGNLGASHVAIGANTGGAWTVTLAKPSPTSGTGTVDMAVYLGPGLPAAAPQVCPTWTPAPGTLSGPGLDYLRGNWCGANYDKDPDGKITLGVSRTKFIFFRENY